MSPTGVKPLRLTTYQEPCHTSSETRIGTPSEVFEKQRPHEAFRPVDLPTREPHGGRRWASFSRKSEGSADSSNGANFLLSASGGGTSSTVTTQDEAFWPLPESERRMKSVN